MTRLQLIRRFLAVLCGGRGPFPREQDGRSPSQAPSALPPPNETTRSMPEQLHPPYRLRDES